MMKRDTKAQRTCYIVPRARCLACGGPIASDGDTEWCASRCDMASPAMVLCRFMDGASVDDIAARMALPRGTVEATLRAACLKPSAWRLKVLRPPARRRGKRGAK